MLPTTISEQKRLATRFNVWISLRSRWDWLMAAAGIIMVFLLSEVAMDAWKGQRLDVETANKLNNQNGKGIIPYDSGAQVWEGWLEGCVAQLPRLHRAVVTAPFGRTPVLDRYLACLALSDIIPTDGKIFDLGTGAGGTGYALWLGAIAHGSKREVLIDHSSNRHTASNLHGTQVKLKYREDPLHTLAYGCRKSQVHLLSLNLLEMSQGDNNAWIQAIKDCRTLRVAVVMGMDEGQFMKSIGDDPRWALVKSSVELVSYSQYIRCASSLQCTSVPWVIAYQKK